MGEPAQQTAIAAHWIRQTSAPTLRAFGQAALTARRARFLPRSSMKYTNPHRPVGPTRISIAATARAWSGCSGYWYQADSGSQVDLSRLHERTLQVQICNGPAA